MSSAFGAVELTPAALRKVTPSEWLVRFAFGGTVTALTGLVGHVFGPVVGGLFLAFPAILPATMTLVTRHDGRAEAVADARGAVAGSVGLAAFAAFAWACSGRAPAVVVLAVATAIWLVVSVVVWRTAVAERASRPTRAVTAPNDRARG